MRHRQIKKNARKVALRKYAALFLYIREQIQYASKEELIVKVHCIMFQSDFESYRISARPITGLDWRKGTCGPEPILPMARSRKAVHAQAVRRMC